jgi:Asp-tRNA(Asn)/Glu-tRNA(Gln) amidotransferase A subunit family amidase
MPHVALPNRAQRSGVLRGARDVSFSLQYLRNTTIGNVFNLCGLSEPCGFTSQGLPLA